MENEKRKAVSIECRPEKTIVIYNDGSKSIMDFSCIEIFMSESNQVERKFKISNLMNVIDCMNKETLKLNMN